MGYEYKPVDPREYRAKHGLPVGPSISEAFAAYQRARLLLDFTAREAGRLSFVRWLVESERLQGDHILDEHLIVPWRPRSSLGSGLAWPLF